MAAFDELAITADATRHQPTPAPLRPNRGAMDWDDVRVFLAVAREGTMRAAGRALGLSQPTIARRLAAFEATFGGPTLFDRLPEGLRLNAAGEQLVPAAESVEDAMLMHLEAIRAGTGRGVLPCYVGDGHPLLERLTAPIPEIAAEYWIIVHRDLRRAACVRAVIDWVKTLFVEQRNVLAGVLQEGT